MSVPDGAKKPTDRKAKEKAEKYKPGDLFTFEVDGITQTLKDPGEVITPGFLREHRNGSPVNMLYTALELVASEKQLAFIDGMSWPDNKATLSRFDTYIEGFFGASLGE